MKLYNLKNAMMHFNQKEIQYQGHQMAINTSIFDALKLVRLIQIV